MKLFVTRMPQQARKTTRECPRAKNLGHSKGAKIPYGLWEFILPDAAPTPRDSANSLDEPKSIPTVCGLLCLTVSFRVMLSIAALEDTRISC